ncbi:MAG: leucine-rich repeat domain-containing protein [Clostridia bacterium]|nr:leucine-rich repeat domain-containing protein [Clostridia bacterium]
MKKLLACLLAFLLLLCLPALAEEEEAEEHLSGDYSYVVLEDGTAEITEYSGSDDVLEIPSELDGLTVTSIGDIAFSWCSSLTAVTIPDSITSIGDFAFFRCTSLRAVAIPDNITSIGDNNPFAVCTNLKEIYVSIEHPYLVTIDGVLFSKPDMRLICYPCGLKAKEYAIPQGVQIISNYAFDYCSSLTKVTIPDSVTSIYEGAFSFCRSLTEVTIPDNITAIGAFVFYDCLSLTEITIPDSVTNIGENAFYHCPDSLTVTVEHDSYAVQYCKDNGIKYIYPDTYDWLNG